MPILLTSPWSPHLPKSSNCSIMLKDVELSNPLVMPPLQRQPITVGFPLLRWALETAGQHLMTLGTTLTLLLSKTQEPPKSSSPSHTAVTPASHLWWWGGLYPRGWTLESHMHASFVSAQDRAQSLRLNPSSSSPFKETKCLCHIIGC